jgi:gamma-glutamylcysteine synthetase
MSGSRSAAQSSFDRLAMLDRYHGAWAGSVSPAFKECVF